MKRQLKPLAALMCLMGCAVVPVIASADDAMPDAQAHRVIVQHRHTHVRHGARHHVETVTATAQTNSSDTNSQSVSGLSGEDIIRVISESKTYLPFDLDVPGKAFVSTGPYVGVPIQFAGSDLIVNSPSVNTDVQLLTIRKNIAQQLSAITGNAMQETYHTHLLLSGLVEAQADYYNHSGPDNGGYPSSNIDVTSVNLDTFFIGPSDWTLGFAEFTYDNASPDGSPYVSTSGYTVINSRLFVNKAFITIGNFNESPFYGTVGQYYVPFGTYSTVMVSDTLTKILGRTKARALELGAQVQQKDAPYASIYVFKGYSHAAVVNSINNGGVNVGYKFSTDHFGGDFGGGLIANIADSAGMQLGAGLQDNELIAHRVPAYDLRGNFSVGEHLDFIAEFIGATNSFNQNDVSFNNHGAKPTAFDLEGAYSFYAWDRPSSIGLGYGQSNQALALGEPRSRASIVFNTSLWRNTIQSIEFRHDREYNNNNTANGPVSPLGLCTAATCTQTGGSDNAVTAQFDYYF